MLPLVRCTVPQQRRRGSRNGSFFAVVLIFIVSPSSSSANQNTQNIHEFPSYTTAPLDVLSSSPNIPFERLSLLKDSGPNWPRSTHLSNQFTYQDPQTSPSQQPFLKISNALISRDETTWESAFSRPSISTQALNQRPATFIQSRNYEDHLARPQTRQIHPAARVSHLVKRQPADSASTRPAYFPQPFDTSLGTEFESDTCQPFMSKFLNNPSFQHCYPFSLLLSTSEAFFRAYAALNPAASSVRETSIMPVNEVLDAACKVDVDQCAALLDQLAVSINSTTIGCGKDLEKQNSLPLQALEGLRNYKLMRKVACLMTNNSAEIGRPVQNGTKNQDDRTLVHGSANNSTLNSTQLPARYCFEKAVSSITPNDLYYYYLPLGTGLPSGTQSSCDECTRSIMKLYSIEAANMSLAISRTYVSARTMTNSECGPGFAPLPINMANRLASAAHRCIVGPSTFLTLFATGVIIIHSLSFRRI